MTSIPWILISVAVLIVLLAVIFIFALKKNKRREPDYFTFFILGIIWLGAGIPLGINSNNWGFFIMGIAFMIIGLVNKDKWKKNHVRYKDLTPSEKKIKFWILIILGILVLAGLVVFWIFM